MPSFKIAGKSKEDLVAIAQIAGLLTAEQAQSMTRLKLARFLEQENAKVEAAQPVTGIADEPSASPPDISDAPADQPVDEAETAIPVVKKTRTAASRRKKSDPSAENQNDGTTKQPETAVTVRKRRTAGRPRKAAETVDKTSLAVQTTESSAVEATSIQASDSVKKSARRRKKTAEETGQPLPIESLVSRQIDPVTEQSSETAAEEKPEVAATKTKTTARKRKGPGRPRKKVAAADTDRMSTAESAGLQAEQENEPAVSSHLQSEPDQPAVLPAAPEAIEESSPEATEAATERDEPADNKKPTTTNYPGKRPHSDFSGSMTRIPRSRISTRQIRPIDVQTDISENDGQAESPEAPEHVAVQTGTDQKAGTDVRLPEADTGKESGVDQEDKPDTTAIPASEGVKEKKPVIDSGEVQGGVLEIMPDGYGFLRKDNYLQGNKDIYVPPQYIRRFGLRPGDFVTGPVRLQRENDRYQALLYIKDVNGMPPEKMIRRPHFDRLTPIYPDERFILETVRNELSTRIIDLVAPIGKGQRGMIVSPPKAGKTILLQKIANAVSINNPDTKLIVLLIDERPEEVTDMQRSINGEVVYSTFDKTPENHTKVVELVLERAMRLVELKQDVMILLDSMTRLARAYNLTINPTGRTLSGGLDPGALYGPKRFFGAARNIENGGSLTIIATSLIETGSRMDEVIFEEFKGTGNMEVYLDRKLSEKRIFPAIDINKSGTRREELLMNNRELDAVWTIRKAFGQLDTAAVTEAIINLLLKTKNNEHFISSVNVSFNDKNVFEAMRGTRPGSQSAGTGTNGGYNSAGGSYNSAGYGSNYRRHSNPGGGGDDD
ncbi:MAG: transcription termination factor Rho [Bacillota bacterium]|nr:transcription termination factor Rho [Bacillota bacterium]